MQTVKHIIEELTTINTKIQVKESLLIQSHKDITELKQSRKQLVDEAITLSVTVEELNRIMNLAGYSKRQKHNYRLWLDYGAPTLNEALAKDKEFQAKKVTRDTIQAKGVSKHKATKEAKEQNEVIKDEIKIGQNAQTEKCTLPTRNNTLAITRTTRHKLTKATIKDIDSKLKELGLTEEDIAEYKNTTQPKAKPQSNLDRVKQKNEARFEYNQMLFVLANFTQSYNDYRDKEGELARQLNKFKVAPIMKFLNITDYHTLTDPKLFKVAYRAKAKQLHPDLTDEDTTNEMQILNNFVEKMKEIHSLIS